jgi:microcystin synthetase protein McyG
MENEPIAIVGIGCRFPGVEGPEGLWNLLLEGKETVGKIPETRRKHFSELVNGDEEIFFSCGGFFQSVGQFDAEFFNISPKEAESLDPQQRLLAEVSYEAFENAGLTMEKVAGSATGVYVGLWTGDYESYLSKINAVDLYMTTGTGRYAAAGRLSYLFDLQGPSLTVDTACSSSLVAVHLACQSLKNGECHVALAGGVNLILMPDISIAYSKAGILSPDGCCKFGDEKANGYVRGEGCGVVVLKKLSHAIEDNDRIYALIRGSAVNNDGRQGLFVAPTEEGQKAVLRTAYHDANIEVGRLGYVEAHGTGTAVGDPVELKALGAFLQLSGSRDIPCWVGSIKTNIGHTEAAAGVAGLIKTALILHHRSIPPSLHFNHPNPNIKWADYPFRIVKIKEMFHEAPHPFIAGVNSFGITGTNAHVVLEEAPSDMKQASSVGASNLTLPTIIPISGKCRSALRETAVKLKTSLEIGLYESATLDDIAYTASVRRSHYEFRAAMIAYSKKELSEQLERFTNFSDEKESRAAGGTIKSDKIVFVFSGQGPQWFGMGRQLLEQEPIYREMIERCNSLLEAYANWSLLDELRADESVSRVNQTEIAQPALFALQMGLAALWRSWGIEPDAIVGHSVGEVAAACFSGVLSLEDAVRVVYHRGRLLQRATGQGCMAAADISQEEAERLIADYQGRLTVAAINSPTSVTLSGEKDALEQVLGLLKKQNVFCRMLPVNYAFHSPQIEPFRQEMTQSSAGIETRPAAINVMSSVTGKPAENTDFGSEYWAENIRRPVRFAEAIDGLILKGHSAFVEIGPHPVLSLSISQCLSHRSLEGKVFPSLRRGKNDKTTLLETLGGLYTLGRDVNWKSLHPLGGCCVPLPSYPWQKKGYWIQAPQRRKDAVTAESSRPSEGSSQDLLMELRWLPRRNLESDLQRPSATYLPDPGLIANQLGKAILDNRQGRGWDSVENAALDFDRLSAGYVINALCQLKWDLHLGDSFIESEFAQRLGILDRHRRLFGRMLEMIEQDGSLRKVGGAWTVTHVIEKQDVQSQWSAMIRRYPDLKLELEILNRCGNFLGDVMTGNCNPLEVLFPQGSLSPLEKLYEGSMMTFLPNLLIRRAINVIMEKLPEGQTIRILELGAGTGGTTVHILPELPADRTDYLFTDVSNLFLERAREKFCRHPFMRYELLDVEQDPSRQGFSRNQFDVVLASNVIHATVDLRQSLQNVASLLAPGGIMLLVEGVRPTRWIDLIFGQLEGWWRFTDTDLRPSYPLLNSEAWIGLLNQLKFEHVEATTTADAAAGRLFEQAVIVAKSASAVTPVHLGQKQQRTPSPEPWVLFSDTCGIGESIAESIRAHGGRCLLVFQGDRIEKLGEDLWRLNPFDSADYQKLVQEVRREHQVSFKTWVHLWSLDNPVYDRTKIEVDLEETVSRSSKSAISLLQAMAEAGHPVKTRFYLVTRGAQCIDGGRVPPNLAQAPLWGIGRTAANEYPDFWGGIIDLDPLGEADLIAQTVLDHVCHSDDEDQAAYRGADRYVPRFLPLARGESQSFVVKPDGSYLITGGLGDLGIETARWLVKHGAKRIILIGRTPLPPQAQWPYVQQKDTAYRQIEAIIGMEKVGAEVRTASVDVANEAQLRDFLKMIHMEKLTPVRGVVHAAGQFNQCLLQHHDEESFKTDLRSKMMGAWLLHDLLKQEPLDFFVLYSSLNSLLGLVGLSSYAASNAFLDAIAHYRKAMGLPALSVNWGPWAGLGFLRKTVTERAADSLFQEGFEGILPGPALEALGWLMQQQVTQAGIAKINGAKLRQAHPSRNGLRLLSELDTPQPSDDISTRKEKAEKTQYLREMIAGIEPGAPRRDFLETSLRGMLADVLRLEPAAINRDKPMGEFGLDSLMAVELKNRCEKALEITLPATLAWNYPTVAVLANHLLEVIQLSLSENAEASNFSLDPPSSLEFSSPQMFRETFDEINHLSEEEALQKLLKKA